MDRYRLSFNEAEEAFVAKIDFGAGHQDHSDRHGAYLANQEPILALLGSLNSRGAIPAHRLSYLSDPAYNPRRRKESREQMFERNGNAGQEIYVHPGFVKHLRYLLFGADLPDAVAKEFEQKVGNPEWVSYGDALDLGKFARSLVRRHALQPSDACEEFFKLSLDIGLSLDESLRIRQIVSETR